jgi:hypothetical protein
MNFIKLKKLDGAGKHSSRKPGNSNALPGTRRATKSLRFPVMLLLCVSAAVLLGGCTGKRTAANSQSAPVKHQHKPPHGGTPVVLGKEEYHLELVLDPAGGKLQAFVLDGEMENFVRISAATFQIGAKLSDHGEALVFNAVANNATGESVGDTSMFEASASWLNKGVAFDAVMKEIEVRSHKYQNVTFNFPRGNDNDEK